MTNLPPLSERIETSLQALSEGVADDSGLMIVTALEALAALMVESIEARRLELLHTIQRGFEDLFSTLKIIDRAASGDLSVENLQRILRYTPIPDDTSFELNGPQGERIALIIAENHVKFTPEYNPKTFKLLDLFLRKKIEKPFSFMFSYICSNLLRHGDEKFVEVARHRNYIFNEGRYNRYAPKEMSLVAKAIVDNSEVFWSHVQRLEALDKDKIITFSFNLVRELHDLGLKGAAEFFLPRILEGTLQDRPDLQLRGRQYLEAEEMGVPVSKERIRGILLGHAGCDITEAELAFAAGSKSFTASDFKQLIADMRDEHDDPELGELLSSISPFALAHAYEGKTNEADMEMMNKTLYLIKAVFDLPGNPDLTLFKSAVLSLPGLPKRIFKDYPMLADHRLGQDLGL